MEDQKIVFRGELMPERKTADAEAEAEGAKASEVTQTSDLDEIFFLFNARDEREPHEFIKADPLYKEGVVKEWSINELDITHTERDDELIMTGKF